MFNKPIRDDLSFKQVLEVVCDFKDLILAESKWDYQCLAELNTAFFLPQSHFHRSMNLLYFLFCFVFCIPVKHLHPYSCFTCYASLWFLRWKLQSVRYSCKLTPCSPFHFIHFTCAVSTLTDGSNVHWSRWWTLWAGEPTSWERPQEDEGRVDWFDWLAGCFFYDSSHYGSAG